MGLRTTPACLAVAWLATAALAQVDQRPGQDGVFGKDYRINREYPLQFILEKVEYTVGRVRLGDAVRGCQADEKLMVVHFAVQNATNDDSGFRFDTIAMTAVDDQQQNFEYRRDYAADGTGQLVDLLLKPAQKMRCYAVLPMPAAARITKLMILPRDDNDPVLRYALDGKIDRLPETVADPADKTGLTPAAELAAKVGEWRPIGQLDVRIDAGAASAEAIADNDLPEGRSWYAVTLTLRNGSPAKQLINERALTGKLGLTDETEVEQPLLVMPKAAKPASFDLPAGAERAVRLFFAVGPDDKPAAVRVRGLNFIDGTEGESREVVVPLSAPPAG